jgi:hypothetical protein
VLTEWGTGGDNRGSPGRSTAICMAAEAGDLMAIGGWESEHVLMNRYYRSGAEHTCSGLAKSRAARPGPTAGDQPARRHLQEA